jgi:DNA uptake protein ComE-like DNA-binding protein
MKRTLFFALSLALLAAIGCTKEQTTPAALRHDAAKAEADVKKDAKAVEQEVKTGLKTKDDKDRKDEKDEVNINSATRDELEALPGIGDARARRIIAGRPYLSKSDLLRRHVVTRVEYDRISGQVVAQ